MKDLVVDVGVLMSASGLGAPEYHDPSFELATKIEACTNLFLAMDGRRRIEYQYQEKMRPGTFGRELLIRLATNNKLVIVPVKPVPKATRVALMEAHFDPEDFKYVQTAFHTSCKVLVSHDTDYSAAVCSTLRKIDVRIRSAAEVVAECSNRGGDCVPASVQGE